MNRTEKTIAPNETIPLGLVLPILQFAFAVLLATSLLEAADGKKLTAPVKFVGQQQPENDSEMPAMPAMQTPEQQPVLPDGRYPQYQLGLSQRSIPSVEDANNAQIRFFLFLQKRPFLVEANIQIDGQPYGMAREQRIEQLLIDARKAPAPAIEVPESFESPTKADSTESVTVIENDQEAELENPEEEEADQENEDAEEEMPTVNPPTVAEYQIASNSKEFLRRYMKTIGPDLSREEIHWLLNNRIDGPVLLKLVENFQHFRASQRPLFDILDLDRDGMISDKEISNAHDNLTECDLNRDSIVSYAELAEVADDPRIKPSRLSEGSLLVVLAKLETTGRSVVTNFNRYQQTDEAEMNPVTRFDSNGDGKISINDLNEWSMLAPDVTLDINFNRLNPQDSEVNYTQQNQELLNAEASVDGTTIRMKIDGQPIEISALQRDSSDQISIGAVQDGYPILPAIDPNSDGRLTIRELRSIVERLQQFDQDGDHSITSSEAQSTIRVCIGLGATVDSELASIRSLTNGDGTPTVVGPDWFARMDRNKDNDLMRDEFPGTDEQFATLDADADELISAQEAIAFEK